MQKEGNMKFQDIKIIAKAKGIKTGDIKKTRTYSGNPEGRR